MPKTGYTRDMDKDYVVPRWIRHLGAAIEIRNPYLYTYKFEHGGYHRCPRTQNERRQNFADEADGLPVRRRRLASLPHSWDDLNRGRNYGKSWKDYTKKRKQWERW